MLETIIAALLSFYPKIGDEALAREHVQAALDAEAATGIPATLLLGQAYSESRYSPYALSRMECTGEGADEVCARKTGIWKSVKKPKGAKTSWYCGVLQVGGYVPWSECVKLRDISYNYLTGAKHLKEWMDDSHCSKRKDADTRLHCALLGYGGGYQAIESWTSTYPARVLAKQKQIQRLIDKQTTS